MIPLLFIALALGVGLATYEFSPKAHAWADEHVRAFQAALAAHRAAEVHLAAAHSASDLTTAVQHVHEAVKANRVAAQETASAAKTAKTEPQRAAAAESATAVVVREEKITTALANLGVGQCDARSFAHVTPQIRDALLARLHSEGMSVTGSNPWDIDTHNHDVKLRAAWDPEGQELKIIVTSGKGGFFGLVTCAEIWAKIDPIMREVVGP